MPFFDATIVRQSGEVQTISFDDSDEHPVEKALGGDATFVGCWENGSEQVVAMALRKSQAQRNPEARNEGIFPSGGAATMFGDVVFIRTTQENETSEVKFESFDEDSLERLIESHGPTQSEAADSPPPASVASTVTILTAVFPDEDEFQDPDYLSDEEDSDDEDDDDGLFDEHTVPESGL